jgi:hypothetical protein
MPTIAVSSLSSEPTGCTPTCVGWCSAGRAVRQTAGHVRRDLHHSQLFAPRPLAGLPLGRELACRRLQRPEQHRSPRNAGIHRLRPVDRPPRHRGAVRRTGTADGRRRLGPPAAAAVHADRARFLLRRDGPDRRGSLAARQGRTRRRRRILLLAAVGTGHQRRAARRTPWPASLRAPAAITSSALPTTSPHFTPMFWLIKGWSATTSRQGSRYRPRTAITRSTRSRSRTTDRERSVGSRR